MKNINLQFITKAIFTLTVSVLFSLQSGYGNDIIEWDGKDWAQLNTLFQNADNNTILVKYNNEIYEVGGFATPDGGFSSYFKKQTVTAINNNDNIIASSENLIKVYPNPFTESVTLSFQTEVNLTKSPITLTFYDVMGRMVKRIDNINTQTITISRDDLPQGMYYYKTDNLGSGTIAIN